MCSSKREVRLIESQIRGVIEVSVKRELTVYPHPLFTSPSGDSCVLFPHFEHSQTSRYHLAMDIKVTINRKLTNAMKQNRWVL